MQQQMQHIVLLVEVAHILKYVISLSIFFAHLKP